MIVINLIQNKMNIKYDYRVLAMEALNILTKFFTKQKCLNVCWKQFGWDVWFCASLFAKPWVRSYIHLCVLHKDCCTWCCLFDYCRQKLLLETIECNHEVNHIDLQEDVWKVMRVRQCSCQIQPTDENKNKHLHKFI